MYSNCEEMAASMASFSVRLLLLTNGHFMNLFDPPNKFRCYKSVLRGLMVSVTFTLGGCDVITDCLDDDGPVFNRSTLPPATLNQVYTETIVASIENEPRDDNFDYSWSITDGALPVGITTMVSGRRYTLSGTPIELGVYDFQVNVTVDDGLDSESSGLCYRNRSKNFQLQVQQDGP